jgi:competence protein ComEC
MKKILEYLPLHFSVFVVFGVLTGYYFSFDIKGAFFFTALLLSLLLAANFFVKKQLRYLRCFQLFSYLLFFFLGILSISIQKPKNQKTHYSHYLTQNAKILFQIEKELKPTPYYNKYYIHILKIDSIRAKGRILLNIKKDSLNTTLKIGQVYYTKSTITEINTPKNPHVFDYKDYLKKKGVIHQISLKNKELKYVTTDLGFFTQIAHLRKHIQKSLKNYSFGRDELGIINALILGQKQDISRDLLQNYANAGAIHLLAVSGLHVGILFLLLSFLLKPLELYTKGAYIKTFLILLILWGFALLTGLSSSVVRAVSMFSFIAVGTTIRNHKLSVIQALISSFFVLVLLHPLYIFDVGFQMSYIAVLGIVLLYPEFTKFIPHSRWFFFRKLTQLAIVSISATLVTLPISLYYFHQFPGLFFLSNMLIMPFVEVIMGLGILVVFLASFHSLPLWLMSFYDAILWFMNQTIRWIAQQEDFLFKNISFSLEILLVSYLLIGSLYWFWINRNKKKQHLFLYIIILFQSILFFQKYRKLNNDELLIFNKSRHTLVGINRKNELKLFSSLDSTDLKPSFINAYCVKKEIDRVTNVKLNNVINYKKHQILVIDSLGIYKNISLKPDIILLRQSPKINLQRLLNLHRVKWIVADASNYKTDVLRWQETCKKNKVAFHYTYTDNAFILKK